MKKWIILISIIIALIPIVTALEECQRETEPTDIPCVLATGYQPINSCETYIANIYNESGGYLSSQTMGTIGMSGRCNVTFNYTGVGQYYINSTMGETWNVLVGTANMMLSIIIGIGLVVVILFWLAFKLDEQHFILKLLLIISGITLLILVPVSTFQSTSTGLIFYRIFLYIFVAIWLYIITYFFYWLFNKMRSQVKQS